MLPIFAGRAPNYASPINRNHPLYLAGMVAAYRFIPPWANNYTVRNLVTEQSVTLTGSLDAMLLLNARIYGPDGPVYGSSARQATAQYPRVPATIWEAIASRPISLALWVKFNSFPNAGAVLDTAIRDFSVFVGGGSPTANNATVYRFGVSTGTITLNQSLEQDVWYRIVVTIASNGAVVFYVNGVSLGTGSVGAGGIPVGIDTLDFGDNSGGGGNNLDGYLADIFLWPTPLTADQVLLDWQEANAGFPGLFPSRGIWERAPFPDTSATATVSSIGTIALTAPTVTAYEVNDATATVGTIGVITLTAPTATAGESNTGSVTTIGTIVLTPPTVSAGSLDNTATVGLIGVIYLYAPTVHPIGSRPPDNYQQQFYWGRFARGQYLRIMFNPLYLPDEMPEITFWHEATTAIRTFSIPVLDPDEVTFGIPLLIDGDFDDGHYVATISFAIDHVSYSCIAYMEVVGGSSFAPATSILEIDRSNGRAVVYSDNEGYARIGYSPSLSGELE